MMMIPDREASTRALRTYWVTRLVIILEFVLSTTAACLEMLQTALGIDVAAWSRYDAKYGNQHSDDDDDDDDKNNNFLAEKARLVEQCLCFREKKAGRRRISPTGEAEASLTAGGGDSSDSVGNSAIDLWELRELALSKGGLVKGTSRVGGGNGVGGGIGFLYRAFEISYAFVWALSLPLLPRDGS